jgi:hypothetical protein
MDNDAKYLIINNLKAKSALKQRVYDNTFEAFKLIKAVLQETESDYNDQLSGTDNRIRLFYKERAKFETQIKVAGDILIFSMPTDVFKFNMEHHIWKTSYIENNRMNSYCGVINIYNFLTDSFDYNRLEDLGYLIARIFVNHQNHYFVEGKRQLGYLYNDFESARVTKEDLRKIINSAILYSMDFDLLIPPYDNVKIISVSQLNDKILTSQLQTGKRLGFKFNSDDVNEQYK